MSHPKGMFNMNHQNECEVQPRSVSGCDDSTVKLPERSPSSSSSSTRTPPSTPATSRTEPTISRPRPPRRHTDKPSVDNLRHSDFDEPLLCTTGNPYTERAYHWQTLHLQNERAKRLIDRIESARVRLQFGVESHKVGEARKLRKEIRKLNKKRDENAEQERRTFVRLGELSYEIQSRERLVQLQQQWITALMAQQHQQSHSPHMFASVVDHPRVGLTVALPSGQRARAFDETCPPPPPPPTADPCFSSFPPLSPCTSSCLSPLSPSFVMPWPMREEAQCWSSRLGDSGSLSQHDDDGYGGEIAGGVEEDASGWGDSNPRGQHHDDGDVSDIAGGIEEDTGDSREYTPGDAARSRASSIPRISGCGVTRNRGTSVPAARREWADKALLKPDSEDA